MVQTAIRRPVRRATPERWQGALRRALAEGVQVRQLAGSGAWIATSGTDAASAYLVTGDSCECQAAEHGDPICKHRASFWHAQGALHLDPEPDAAPVVAVVVVEPAPAATCPTCGGNGIDPDCRGHRVAPGYFVHCPCFACDGSGAVAVAVVLTEQPARAAA
ncbi:MAG: hypothetical protein M3R02_28990 [Chloroflexota bacterium]|nr:hypothetical protein [Chloroflexota bacterium]